MEFEETSDPSELEQTLMAITEEMPYASAIDRYAVELAENELSTFKIIMAMSLFYIRLRSLYTVEEIPPVLNTMVYLGEVLLQNEIMKDDDGTTFAPLTKEKLDASEGLHEYLDTEIDWGFLEADDE